MFSSRNTKAPDGRPLSPLSEHSLPSGAEAGNMSGIPREPTSRPGLNVSRRGLFQEGSQPRSSTMSAPPARPSSSIPQSTTTPIPPLNKDSIVEKFADSLSAVFNEVGDRLDALDRARATISEWDRIFGCKTWKEKEEHVKVLSLEDARELLLVELQRADQSQRKTTLLTKRATDLEKKLADAETYASRFHDAYYQKTHDAVAALLSSFRAREDELLARVERSEQAEKLSAAQSETLSRQLKDVERREEALRKELSDVNSQLRTTQLQRDQVDESRRALQEEKNRLRAALTTTEDNLRETTKRETEARTEATRRAEEASKARVQEEKRVAEMTREMNRKMSEAERRTNDDAERRLREAAAEHGVLKAKLREAHAELMRETDRANRMVDRADAAEREAAEWQQRFDKRLEEANEEIQLRLASGYRGMMSDFAPRRRIGSTATTARTNDENAGRQPSSTSSGRLPHLSTQSARDVPSNSETRKRHLQAMSSTTVGRR